MRLRSFVLGSCLSLALACPGAAHAEELTSAEKGWVRACTEALAAPSLVQRESAAAALGRIGPSALATMITSLGRFKQDEHWDALEMACLAMGAQNAVAGLEAARGAWPKAMATRLQTLLDRVRETSAKGPTAPAATGGVPAPLPQAAVGVAGKVARALDSVEAGRIYSARDTQVAELKSMGREVIPALLEELKRRSPDGMAAHAAGDVLAEVLAPGDVPHVAQLLADGHLAAGRGLAKQSAQLAVPALLVPLGKGLLSYALLDGLEPFGADPRVGQALIKWLEAQEGEDESFLAGKAAELLGKQRVKAAVPVLEKLAAHDAFRSSRRALSEALVDLGARYGVLALIKYFCEPPKADTPKEGTPKGLDPEAFLGSYERRQAGERLNLVAGRPIFKWKGGANPFAKDGGNWDEASREFQAWWESVKEKLRYDEKRQAWVTE